GLRDESVVRDSGAASEVASGNAPSGAAYSRDAGDGLRRDGGRGDGFRNAVCGVPGAAGAEHRGKRRGGGLDGGGIVQRKRDGGTGHAIDAGKNGDKFAGEGGSWSGGRDGHAGDGGSGGGISLHSGNGAGCFSDAARSGPGHSGCTACSGSGEHASRSSGSACAG